MWLWLWQWSDQIRSDSEHSSILLNSSALLRLELHKLSSATMKDNLFKFVSIEWELSYEWFSGQLDVNKQLNLSEMVGLD